MQDHDNAVFDASYDGPLSEPVPALVNAVLLNIAKAYIPPLRTIDEDGFLDRMWVGEPRLVFVPFEELDASGGTGPDAEGHALALGTVAFGAAGADGPGDEFRVFLNVIPYSEQNIEIALEADALAHAMGVHSAQDTQPVHSYSLWFAAGAPEEKADVPEVYVTGQDAGETAEAADSPSQIVTLIAYTGEWPPEDGQEHEHLFWDLLSQLADRVVVSLSD